jgi:hypothetical protein
MCMVSFEIYLWSHGDKCKCKKSLDPLKYLNYQLFVPSMKILLTSISYVSFNYFMFGSLVSSKNVIQIHNIDLA